MPLPVSVGANPSYLPYGITASVQGLSGNIINTSPIFRLRRIARYDTRGATSFMKWSMFSIVFDSGGLRKSKMTSATPIAL